VASSVASLIDITGVVGVSVEDIIMLFFEVAPLVVVALALSALLMILDSSVKKNL
jgi:hypothetical protein